MRKAALFMALIILSCAQALTIDINNPAQSVTGNDNITLNYEITLDEESLTSYSIILSNEFNDYSILNKTTNLTSIQETINYNVSNIASGEYSIRLELSQPFNHTIKSINNITVQQDVKLRVSNPETVYLMNDEEVIKAQVSNLGNTELSVSSFFLEAESEITISPQSFTLLPGNNRELTITITKPTNSYEATLVLLSGDVRVEKSISVINPIINLTHENYTINTEGNETIINALIKNNGNLLVNGTFKVRTFTIFSGYQIYSESFSIPANELINLSLRVPASTIVSLETTYQGQSIIEELNILNKLPFNLRLSQERLILIGALIGVVIIILYFKFKRKRRP